METYISFKVLNEYLNVRAKTARLLTNVFILPHQSLVYCLVNVSVVFVLFVCLFFLYYLGIPEWGVTKSEQRGMENEHGERDNEK